MLCGCGTGQEGATGPFRVGLGWGCSIGVPYGGVQPLLLLSPLPVPLLYES